MNPGNVVIAIFVAAATMGVGIVCYWIGGQFKFDPAATTHLVQRLQQMALLTIVIERAVEVYLGVSQQNGPDRHDPAVDRSSANARRPASIVALTLGILIAIVGVRILDTIGTLTATSIWATAIWNGVDVVLSGGLLAGGSFLIHEVTEMISGTIKRVDPSTPKAPADAANVVAPNAITPDALARILALAPTAPPSSKGQPVIDRCESAFDANKNDCSAFVRAVAAASGIALTGQADDIVDQVAGAGWVKLTDGVQAASMADAGMLVIAGLKSSEHTPARSNGHVAVVVSGPLANGKYPTGYWGSSGGASGKNQTLNYSWNPADRDNVHYAAHSI
jgi:hypothetical protein